MDDYLQTKEKLAYGYKVARWINDSDEYDAGFFESFQKNVKEDRLGDSETANDIKALLLDIEQEPPIEPPGLPEGQEDIPTLRQLSISLGTLFTKLIDMKRSLRFAQGVQDSRLNLKNGLSLSCFKCRNTSKSSEKHFLLSQCGHMVCNRCLPGHYDACHGPTCLAGNSHYNKLPVKALVSGESSTTLSKAGKIYDVVDYIKNQIPRDEKVLVFVQFPKLFKAVEAALKEDNIDFCDIRGAVGSWKVLSQFQKAGNGSKRVMILNIGDASASGR
jgi:SNF2 family DNA or RNA helicase